MAPKEVMWNFKASSEFLERLRTASDVLDVPASQIAREAISARIDKLSKRNPRLAAALAELGAA
jgi:hypothetical protein